MKVAVVATFFLAGAFQFASASMVLVSPIAVTGNGFGTVATLLTIQNNPSETGCVGATNSGASLGSGGLCVGSSADVKPGAPHNGPQPLSASGITDATNFAVVFNADQPAGDPITLTGLTASFYTPTGTFLYQTAGFSCPGLAVDCTFPATSAGIGKSGFVFGLDASQQAAATAAGVFSNNNNLVGLSASLSDASGGPETFYLGFYQQAGGGGGGGGGETPEPATLVMAFSGIAMVLVSRKFLARRPRLAQSKT